MNKEQQAIQAAREALGRMVRGEQRVHIPVRPDDDDVLIADILTLTEKQAAALKAKDEEISRLLGVCQHSEIRAVEAEAEIEGLLESLGIAVSALREIEEGFRLSVHGNPTCYHIAAEALSRIAKQND